jgi:hypothetical protein
MPNHTLEPPVGRAEGHAPPVADPVRQERVPQLDSSMIENRTARRIAIGAAADGECLVLPPFGRRPITGHDLDRLDLKPWTSRGLIRVEQHAQHDPGQLVSLSIGLGVWVVLVAGVVLVFNGGYLRSTTFWSIVGGVLLALAFMGSLGYARARENVGRAAFRALRWLGVGAVLTIGFGVPWLLQQRQIDELGGSGAAQLSDLCRLFLLIFVVFVGIVSTLPAMLYFLFDEQRMECVRDNFFRDVMRLDPAMQTMDDADAVYGPLVQEVFGGRRKGTLLNLSVTPVLLSTLLVTLGWTAALLPTLDQISERTNPVGQLSLVEFMAPRAEAFTFAFMGAYFFTLNMVFRRYVRADLGPKAYSHVSIRIIIAVVLSWVAGTLPAVTSSQATEPTALLLVLAFFIGIVPETGTAIYHDFLQSQQGWIGKAIPSIQEQDPLSRLQGITLYDRARLLEEGIENVENLAHHNLVELMLRTRIPTSRLVDLVDQAVLYLHVSESRDGADREEGLDTLRRLGIRTATDLETAGDAADAAGLGETFYGVLGEEGGMPRLRTIRVALADDEWMIQLRHWRNYRMIYDRLFSYESFYPQAVERQAA